MIDIKFIGIECINPNWDSLGNLIRNNLMDWIDIGKCGENNLTLLYESEPHVTIIYQDIPLGIGPNITDFYLKIKNRDLYQQLKLNKKMILPELIIDTFDNPDARVLKINVENADIFPILDKYNSNLLEQIVPDREIKDYHAHLTLTYLKPDTPNQVIDEFRKLINPKDYLTYDLTSFMISGGDRRSIKILIR